MQHFKKISALILTVLIALPASSYAVGSGGFENASFGAADYGKGLASTANPTNPATISINPAGLNELPGVQVQGNLNLINMWTKIESAQVNGGSTQSSSTVNVIPTTYVSYNPGKKMGLNDRVAFGIGVDSPFGLANKYDSSFTAVKYTGHRNWIKMYAIKPVASFRFADWLNIAAGPIWYRAFDVGQIAQYRNAAVGGSTDGQVRAGLTGNAWGWQMGALLKPAPKHKVGVYFRSPTLIRLKGMLKGENLFQDTGASNGTFETGIHTEMHLPLNLTTGYNYKINEKTDVGVDLGWTRWSVFDNFYVPVDPIQGGNLGAVSTGNHNSLLNSLFNTPGPGGVGDKDWNNSLTLNLGGEHKLRDNFRIRAGTYYFWTPIPKNHFTPVVPDANRWAIAFGFGYDITKKLTWDVSYVAQFFVRRQVDNDISNALGTSVDGTYSSFIQAATTGLTYKWGAEPAAPIVEDWEGSMRT